ncbi:laccase isoform X2 [Nilaparvata lugens]|uniref:laccase isoform X2 n=1 Tax=Nilaparvata lugens TaxID=108931 RepID=UPI00193D616F|nr:laccase isoform X2 [Nilaparvata lugens]
MYAILSVGTSRNLCYAKRKMEVIVHMLLVCLVSTVSISDARNTGKPLYHHISVPDHVSKDRGVEEASNQNHTAISSTEAESVTADFPGGIAADTTTLTAETPAKTQRWVDIKTSVKSQRWDDSKTSTPVQSQRSVETSTTVQNQRLADTETSKPVLSQGPAETSSSSEKSTDAQLGVRTRYNIDGYEHLFNDTNSTDGQQDDGVEFQHHSFHGDSTDSDTETTTEPEIETTTTPAHHGGEWYDDTPLHHPCLRECRAGEAPMTCHYTFVVELYYAMSKACYNCATNASDCDRHDCIPTNGVKRPIIVVNRTIPGPSIEVCQHDRVIVDVHNHLMEETTSIHWHGHHQRGSPYMDGVPFITQCPVQPRTAFRYSYDAANAGTHFWHSHSGCQRTDGAVGNLIIRQPRVRDVHAHLYDADLPVHVINVMDWAHELGAAMFAAHYHSTGDNKPESILVNGRGRYFNDSQQLTHTPLAVFNVQQNVRYRFRLINAGNQNCPLEMYIENHTMTIINSDGGDIEPIEAATLVSYAGERWDFVLNANASVGNYWIRFKGLMDCDERFTKAHQAAILRYQGAPDEEPGSKLSYHGPVKPHPKVNAMNVKMGEHGTVSIPELTAVNTMITEDPNLKPVADHQFYIAYDFYPVDTPHYHKPHFYGFYDVQNKKERVYTPQFNRVSMHMPSEPLLSQRDDINKDMFCDHSKLNNCTSQSCHCTNVIKIPLGDVVELILIDEGHTYNANHPFHLHGHAFRVVGMDRLGEETTLQQVRSLDKAGRLKRKLTSAPLKDTVTVPDGGYTIIRFHATNPGYWLFHCHLEFHVEVGMAMIFQVGEHTEMPPVPPKFPTCGDYLPSADADSRAAVVDNEIDFGDEYRNGRKSAINASTTLHRNVLLLAVVCFLTVFKSVT